MEAAKGSWELQNIARRPRKKFIVQTNVVQVVKDLADYSEGFLMLSVTVSIGNSSIFYSI